VNTLVLLKQVPDLVEDLELNDDGNGLDPDEVDFKLNEFDDHALEEALLLKEAGGGTVTAAIFDGDGADKILYTALAKGADEAIKVSGLEPEEIDSTYVAAKAFAGLVRERKPDLVVTGVQACDDRDGQLAPLVAALCDLPCVGVVAGVTGGGGKVTVQKELSGGMVAELEMTLPGVLGVQAASKTPRYVPVSKVRQVQGEASLGEFEADQDDPRTKIASMSPPETGAGAKMLGGVEELLDVLKQAGAVS